MHDWLKIGKKFEGLKMFKKLTKTFKLSNKF